MSVVLAHPLDISTADCYSLLLLQVLRVRDKPVFAALDAESRRNVFKEIAQELAMMVSTYCLTRNDKHEVNTCPHCMQLVYRSVVLAYRHLSQWPTYSSRTYTTHLLADS
jgi:hypothetical protein